jgi:hypothetical protein
MGKMVNDHMYIKIYNGKVVDRASVRIMWYIEILIYVMTMLTSMASVLPWSIMTTEHTINTECVVPVGFPFRLPGTMCGLSWTEHRAKITNNLFVYADVAPTSLTLATVIWATSLLLFLYTTVRGTNQTLCVSVSLIVSTTSIYTLSRYVNTMDTVMTIPQEYLFIQGPGYLSLMLASAVSGSIFLTEFFIFIHQHPMVVNDGAQHPVLEILTCFIGMSTVVSVFGPFVNVDMCPDAIGMTDIRVCKGSEFSVVVVMGLASLVGSIALYAMVKFYYQKNKYINALSVAMIVFMTTSVSVTYSTDHFKSPDAGMYSMFIGITLNVVFIMVYNGMIGHCIAGRYIT